MPIWEYVKAIFISFRPYLVTMPSRVPSSTPSAPKPSRREQWDAVADCLRIEKESFGALHTILDGLDQAGKDATWAESDPRFESSTHPTDLKVRAS